MPRRSEEKRRRVAEDPDPLGGEGHGREPGSGEWDNLNVYWAAITWNTKNGWKVDKSKGKDEKESPRFHQSGKRIHENPSHFNLTLNFIGSNFKNRILRVN